jgi:putative transcriptional regulator
MLRTNLGLTQEQLGQLLGVHSLTVSKWERGDRLSPQPYQMALLSSCSQAVTNQPNIGRTIAQLLVGAGIGIALYHLLKAAFHPE